MKISKLSGSLRFLFNIFIGTDKSLSKTEQNLGTRLKSAPKTRFQHELGYFSAI